MAMLLAILTVVLVAAGLCLGIHMRGGLLVAEPCETTIEMIAAQPAGSVLPLVRRRGPPLAAIWAAHADVGVAWRFVRSSLDPTSFAWRLGWPATR